jgi:hypothetical protein
MIRAIRTFTNFINKVTFSQYSLSEAARRIENGELCLWQILEGARLSRGFGTVVAGVLGPF